MTEANTSCKYCGSPLTPEMRFCGACGQPVSGPVKVNSTGPDASQASDPQTPGTPPSEDPVPPVWNTASEAPENQAAQVYQAPPVDYAAPVNAPPANKRNRYLIPGLLAGALILCGCLCLAVFAIFSFVGGNTLRTMANRSETIQEFPFENSITMEAVPVEPTETAEPTDEVEPTETAEPSETAEPTVTVEPTVTLAPTAAAVPTTDAAQNNPLHATSFGGVTFTFDDALGSSAEGKTIPAQTGSDVPPWELGPEYTQFLIDQYPLDGTQLNAEVLVYPVDAYIQANPDVKPRIDGLKQLLKDKPQDKENGSMPFLPFWNAGQVFHAQVKYLDGKGTQGVRYLTQYAQDVSPISNDRMFYTYQGLTDDGKYYITAILPVSSPLTPEFGDLTGSEYDAFVNNYETYLAALRIAFDQTPAEVFTPNLDLLDKMVQTIEVK